MTKFDTLTKDDFANYLRAKGYNEFTTPRKSITGFAANIYGDNVNLKDFTNVDRSCLTSGELVTYVRLSNKDAENADITENLI